MSKVVVKGEPTVKTDGKGWVRIGHEVIYKRKKYFVYTEQTSAQEVAINVMRKSDGKSLITKVHYQLKNIQNITSTQEDFVKFIKYNFVNWITE